MLRLSPFYTVSQYMEQAEAELGQAQPKLRLMLKLEDFNSNKINQFDDMWSSYQPDQLCFCKCLAVYGHFDTFPDGWVGENQE